MIRLLQRIYNPSSSSQNPQLPSSPHEVFDEIKSRIFDGSLQTEDDFSQVLMRLYENIQSVDIILDLLCELILPKEDGNVYEQYSDAVCSCAEASYFMLCEIYWSNTAAEIQHASHIDVVMQLLSLMEARYSVIGDFPFALLRALVFTEAGALALTQSSIDLFPDGPRGTPPPYRTLTVLEELLQTRPESTSITTATTTTSLTSLSTCSHGDSNTTHSTLRGYDEDDIMLTVLILHRMLGHGNGEVTYRMLELGLMEKLLEILDTFISAVCSDNGDGGQQVHPQSSSDKTMLDATGHVHEREASSGRRTLLRRDCIEVDDMSCMQQLLDCLCIICSHPEWGHFLEGRKSRMWTLVSTLMEHYYHSDLAMDTDGGAVTAVCRGLSGFLRRQQSQDAMKGSTGVVLFTHDDSDGGIDSPAGVSCADELDSPFPSDSRPGALGHSPYPPRDPSRQRQELLSEVLQEVVHRTWPEATRREKGGRRVGTAGPPEYVPVRLYNVLCHLDEVLLHQQLLSTEEVVGTRPGGEWVHVLDKEVGGGE